MLGAIVAIWLCLLIVVGVHEAGHAVAARYFGVRIKAIAFGFGSPLLRWRSAGGIDWIWALWPLGGYVRLYNTRIEPVPTALHPVCLDKQTAVVRCAILSAGIISNLLLSWLLFMLVFAIGLPVRPPVMAEVKPDSIMARAGVEPGDTVLAVGALAVHGWQDFGQQMIRGMGQSALPIQRKTSSGQVQQTLLDLQHWQIGAQDQSMLESLGITPDLQVDKQRQRAASLWGLPLYALEQMGQDLSFYVVMIKRLLSQAIPFSLLLGPLGFAEVSLGALQQGLVLFLFFIGHFSLVVALINILPIPGLDGASICYVLLEKIRARPLSVAMELLLHRLAIIAFAVLLFNLLMNDLQRYIV
ncbi:MAG: site-2 protease family protein [Legionellaceae bacterium]|nr:site-2 protease family protein [Legionellaceae bacterium]